MNAGLPAIDITLTVTLSCHLTGAADDYTAAEWPASRARMLAHCRGAQDRLGGGGITVTGNAEAGRAHVWDSAGKTLIDYRWATEAISG